MNNLDKHYLISIKSIIELGEDFSSLSFFTTKLSDSNLADKIINEIKLMNYGKVISVIDNCLYEQFEEPVLFETTDIKIFNFDTISQETIKAIKDKIGIERIPLYKVKDLEGNESSLVRYWDNTNRFAIIIESELVNNIKEDPELELNVSKEIVLANLGYYTKFTIEKYQEHLEYIDDDDYYYDDYNSSNWLSDAAGTDDPEVMNDVYWNLD